MTERNPFEGSGKPWLLAAVFVAGIGLIVAMFASSRKEPCRERTPVPGMPCEWRNEPVRLVVRNGVVLCGCEPESPR